MQEKLNAWQEAANRMREVTSIMNKACYTAPELLDGLRARLIVALIAVADALGVKLVPDFSNVVARQDGVPLEVETFPLEVKIVSQLQNEHCASGYALLSLSDDMANNLAEGLAVRATMVMGADIAHGCRTVADIVRRS